MSFHSLHSTVQRTFAPSPIRKESPQGSIRSLAGAVLLCLTAASSFAQISSKTAAQLAAKPQLQANFGKIPLSFEANRGQVDKRVQFLSRGQGYALFLTPGEAVLELRKGKSEATPSTLRMKLQGANASAAASGVEVLPGTANYFIGNDPAKWHTAVATYKRVQYTGVYPGIDLVFYGNQRELEYDFVLAPNADPKQIALTFTGAHPHVGPSGSLVLTLASGETRFHKPLVYQLDGDRKTTIDAHYEIANNKVSFALGAYDHSKELVIDPVLSYLTYLGGSANDDIAGIAVDAAGSAYVVGTTSSLNFPTKNPYQNLSPAMVAYPNSGDRSIFVTKFNATGTALVYSTYLGSNGNVLGTGIAVDPNGSAYVGGYTDTSGYPITAGAFQPICGAAQDAQQHRIGACTGAGQGDSGGVLTKLSPSGTSLGYSTYLGGNDYNAINAVAVNAAGEAYVTGLTNAFCANQGYQPFQCFPTTTGAAQPGTVVPGGGGTVNYAFFTKFNAAGTALIYSSLLGNTSPNQGTVNGLAVAVDAADNGYIAGSTTSGSLLTTPGSFQPKINTAPGAFTANPAFVAKFDPTAQKLVYSTYLGEINTNSNSIINGIAVDAAGNAYVAGSTQSCSFPTTPGVYEPQAYYPPGASTYCNAGFVSKLNPAGSALVYSTFVGDNPGQNSNNNTYLASLALAPDGSVYVAGSESGYGIQTVNPVLAQTQFNLVGYVAHLDATASTLLFATTIGGTTACPEPAVGIAVDPAGNMYVAGVAQGCSTLPTTPGAFQATSSNPGGNINDGWVAKIAPTIISTTTLAVSPANSTPGQSVTLSAVVAGPSGSAIPSGTVNFLNGSTMLGSGALDATGKATYTTSALTPNTYSLTASYGGSSTYSASVSAAQALTISTIATTTALSIAPASAYTGQSVTIAAKVTPSSGTAIPSGTITFMNGAATLSAVPLDATGKAVLTSSTLPAGVYAITALYSGDATFAASASAAGALTIATPVATSTTLSASATNVVSGASITFTAQVTPAAGALVPTGTVTFNDGTVVLGTGTLDATGKATLASSALTVGSHSVTAVYGGDSANNPSTSAVLAVTVTAAPPAGISVSTTNLTVKAGSSVTTVISVQAATGFVGATTFACSGLPAFTSCSFAPSTVTTSGTTVATTTLTITTNTKTLSGALSKRPLEEQQRNTSPTELSGGLTVVLALLFWVRFGSRKSRKALGRLLLAILSVAAISGVMVGCGGTSSTTPAGTSAVVVTATASGTAKTATINLTVTP